ncbi:hypothetical protein HQ585_18320 [candidate division KSB1 bacterium]|nr:hypothetical protein [candidate division KSB1 bacterium]
MRNFKHPSGFVVILNLILISLFCVKTPESDKGQLVAKVGSKAITTKDILYRAELTPLPPNVNTVQSVLNNLIAEKLMVFEAEDTSSILANSNFQAHIRGIKEQAMRDELYNKTIEKNVQLDEDELQTAFHTSQREYTVSFYNVTAKASTEAIFDAVEENPDAIQEIYNEISQSQDESLKKIKWDETEDPRLFRSLYVNRAEAGEVLAPIRINRSQTLIMRVEDYTTYPMFGGEQEQIRFIDVKNEFYKLESMVQWKQYTSTLMHGKELRFDRDSFTRMIDMLLPIHTSDTGLIKKEQLDQAAETAFSERAAEMDAISDNPLFTFNDEIWTIGDFKNAIASHPLVYKQKEIPAEQFPALFKEAVADLILDHMLNEEAYKRSYDKSSEVKAKAEVWHDAILAKYQLNKTLAARRAANPSDLPAGRHNAKILETYIVELRDKYADQIQIYPKYLESVKLTHVPLLGFRQNVPYPIAVPSFPFFSTADNLIFE